MHLLALLTATVLVSLATLHVYWGLGGRWLFAAAIPHKVGQAPVLPGPIACFVVAALLLGAAYVCMVHAFGVPFVLGRELAAHGVLAIAGVFGLRTLGDFNYVGLFKRVRSTEFARRDSWFYTPITASMATATGLLWLLGRS